MVMKIRSAKKEDIGNILKVVGSDPFGNEWDKPLAERYYKSKFSNTCNCFEEKPSGQACNIAISVPEDTVLSL